MEASIESRFSLRRVVGFLDRMTDRFILLVFIIAILLGLYYTYDLLMLYRGIGDDSLMMYKPGVGDMPLGELSPDVVAWITIDDTNIDQPIMQGETNEDYLNKDPYGKFSLGGSIFLDVRNSADFTDPYSLTYGHHMSHGYMYGDLEKFLEQEFFDGHLTGTLTTVGGKVYKINIFCATTTQTDVSAVFQPEEYADLLPYLRTYADIYNEPAITDRILCMSTCKTPDSIDRTCVFGYLTDAPATEAKDIGPIQSEVADENGT